MVGELSKRVGTYCLLTIGPRRMSELEVFFPVEVVRLGPSRQESSSREVFMKYDVIQAVAARHCGFLLLHMRTAA